MVRSPIWKGGLTILPTWQLYLSVWRILLSIINKQITVYNTPSFSNRYNLLWTQKLHKNSIATTMLGRKQCMVSGIYLASCSPNPMSKMLLFPVNTVFCHVLHKGLLIPPLFQWHMWLNSWHFFLTKQWKSNCQKPALYCQKGKSFHKIRNWKFYVHT